MHAEQIIIIFYIIFFIFYSMYFVLFSIVLYRTIVTVYTDNIFLYNYLRQIHQIIQLSPVGCFTPARGKTVQKNREVNGVKSAVIGSSSSLPPLVGPGGGLVCESVGKADLLSDHLTASCPGSLLICWSLAIRLLV